VAVSGGGTPATPRLRCLVWGTGAIGGTVAAYLRRAGHDVIAVDANQAHVRAIRERGLSVVGPIETFTQPLTALVPDQVQGLWDTVLLCVKAQHTDSAARQAAAHLSDRGAIVSLQNGFNEIAIAEIVGAHRTVGAFINFGADLLEPGVVHFGGRGAVVLGELDGRSSERVVRLCDAIRDFESDAVVSDNIWGYLWGKMGYGAILFATALTDASIVDVLASCDVRPSLTALAQEVMAVAAASGASPMGFNGYDPAAFGIGGSSHAIDQSFEAMIAFNRRSAKTHTGVWRDIAVHRRRTEADAQFGPILAIARRYGVAVPHLERLVVLVGEVETRVRPQAWENLSELARSAETGDAHSL
jgi:2-dehydropantoate 2-reductase